MTSSGVGFLRRLIHLVRPRRADADLEREIGTHLTFLEDDFRRRGQSPDEARRSARLALGGIEQTKELHRDARTWRWLDAAWRDALYAVRMLRRQPATTTAAVLSLAIGIGLNAAVFSIVDWVLLRPLPYPAPHELVRVFTAGTAPMTPPAALTYGEFERFSRSESLRSAAAFSTATRIMAAPGIDPVHVAIARVVGDLFATLGMRPDAGRAFTPEEMVSGAPVVVLAHDLWQRRFAGDRAIIGRAVTIDGAPHTVIGIMPAAQGYPAGAEVWRPQRAVEADDKKDRELQMIGRLRADARVAGASAEIATIASALSNGARDAWADDLQRTDAGAVQAALHALFGAALLTLLIACANVAALVGARGADREGEMAVRGALGATRARVLAQVIVEGLVLAAAGGALGLLVGNWALTALVALAPVGIPRLAQISLDARIVALGLAATVATGLAVGVMPALQLSRVSERAGLNRLGWQRVTVRGNGRRALVLAQIAIAVVLTAGAGLLTRSLQHLVTIDHGFAPDQLVAVDLDLPRGSCTSVPELQGRRCSELFHDLVAASETVPGVRAATVAMRLPTQVPGLRTRLQLLGDRELASPATLRPVSPTFFDTVGIPMTAGRGFADTDSPRAPRVAIVNAAFVRDLLAGGPALDVRVTTPLVEGPIRIVGVVGDITPAGEPDRPALYLPIDQISIGSGYVIVRAQNDPRSILPALTARLRAAAPSLAMDRIHRVADALESSRAVTRFSAQVAATFAGLALLLSMIGVYGLTASDVSARWRELAVRLALGASRRAALWTVVCPCAVVLAVGTALGLVGAVGVGPALASLLHGVRPADIPTLAAAPIVLVTLGLVAAMLAATRVLRADPAVTLRSE